MNTIIALLFSWEGYFVNDTPDINKEKQTVKQRIIVENQQSAFVSNCFFFNINENENGGAIYCNNYENVLIEVTTFMQCKTQKSGGAIYFKTGIKCIIERVCSYRCSCGNSGQFCYLSSANGYDTFNYTSCIYFVSEEENEINTVYFSTKSATMINSNISNNYLCSNPIFESYQCNFITISFSSFVNNTAKSFSCMDLQEFTGSSTFSQCNVLQNKGISKNSAIIFINSDVFTSFCGCCILDNEALLIINSRSGIVRFNNCTLAKNMVHNKYVIESTPEKEFSSAFSLDIKYKCRTIDITDNYRDYSFYDTRFIALFFFLLKE